MTSTGSLLWYLVRTKSRQEARAESNLRSWGIETLAPKTREKRCAGVDGHQTYIDSEGRLFPNYLFARFDAAERLAQVRLTRGVHSVVGFGECATAVDDSVIDVVRQRMDTSGFVRLEEPAPGDRVTIVSGPLSSLEGIFERRTVYYYLQGFDPEFAWYSPGTQIIAAVIEDALREGKLELDFLRGSEAYKYSWGAHDSHTSRLVRARFHAGGKASQNAA